MHTSSALPPDLQDLAVFHQYRHGTLTAEASRMRTNAEASALHVEFDKFPAREFQPLPHLLRVRATRRSEEFKHFGSSLQCRAKRVIDGRLDFLNARNVVAANHQREVRQVRGAEFLRRRIRAARP